MLPAVNVVVVTYRRPLQLREALDSLRVAAARAHGLVRVGVTVVDDDPDGSAAPVVHAFSSAFPDGCRLVPCGSHNISMARNAGLDATLDRCDWIGSIDDDVVVPPTWFADCLAAVSGERFNAVTGPLVKDFSQGPPWLTREPFDQIGITSGVDGELMDVCATGNNWVSAEFVRSVPGVRFDPRFGRTGGEDVDFFYRAVDAGLRPVYLRAAGVTEPQPPERCTFRYQLRRSFWLGMMEARISITQRRASRLRLLARAGRRGATLGARHLTPEQRQRAGLRYKLTILVQCIGVVLGTCGITLQHK